MNLVVGATGLLGEAVCRRLRDADQPVRAMVRRESDAAAVHRLRAMGCETVLGDLRDLRSLHAAVLGMDTVVHCGTAARMARRDAPADRPERQENSVEEVDGRGSLQLFAAARAAGVGHVVFVSISSAVRTHTPLLTAKREAERALTTSGLAWTILRPTYFTEVWAFGPGLGFDPSTGHAEAPEAGAAVSFISVEDVAAFVAGCVGNSAAFNEVVDLGGPRGLTLVEALNAYETVTGRRAAVDPIPIGALHARFTDADDPQEASRLGLLVDLAHGDVVDMEPVLDLLPIDLTPVEQVAERLFSRRAPH